MAYSQEQYEAVADDPRVRNALALALRDVAIRETWGRLRKKGVGVRDAVAVLRGPHRDGQGGVYYLSAERVRSIVYGKGRK